MNTIDGTGAEQIQNISSSHSDQPDSSFEQKEREKIVQQAINSLPKNQRVALILQRYNGMSIHEISEVLGCSMSSIQSRLARAKENLCNKLLPILDDIT